jgi:hypothetical protein
VRGHARFFAGAWGLTAAFFAVCFLAAAFTAAGASATSSAVAGVRRSGVGDRGEEPPAENKNLRGLGISRASHLI